MEEKRINRRKFREGVVLSNKMDKSLVVKVERKFAHKLYKKIIKRSKNYMVHDQEKKANIGDIVKIMETKPISKNKRWILVNIVRRFKGEI